MTTTHDASGRACSMKRLTSHPDGSVSLNTRPATVRESLGNAAYAGLWPRQVLAQMTKHEQEIADYIAEREAKQAVAERAARRARLGQR